MLRIESQTLWTTSRRELLRVFATRRFFLRAGFGFVTRLRFRVGCCSLLVTIAAIIGLIETAALKDDCSARSEESFELFLFALRALG